MFGNGYNTKPGTINTYRVFKCNDTYNKLNDIKIKCANEVTIDRELRNIFVSPYEITF